MQRVKPFLPLIIGVLLILIVAILFVWRKSQDIGDCYDKRERWSVEKQTCPSGSTTRPYDTRERT